MELKRGKDGVHNYKHVKVEQAKNIFKLKIKKNLILDFQQYT